MLKDSASLLNVAVAAGGSGPVIIVTDEADLTNVTQLTDALTAQISSGTQHVIVDLARLRFANPAAIRVLAVAVWRSNIELCGLSWGHAAW